MKSRRATKVYVSNADGRGGIEYLWTEKTFGGYQIRNIPAHADTICYEDVVQIDEATGKIISVVRPSSYRNGYLFYCVPEQRVQAWFKRLSKAFERRGILIEGFTDGMTGMAIPAGTTDDDVRKIAARFPEIMELEFGSRVLPASPPYLVD